MGRVERLRTYRMIRLWGHLQGSCTQEQELRYISRDTKPWPA